MKATERRTYMSSNGILMTDYSTPEKAYIAPEISNAVKTIHSIFNEEELNELFANNSLLISFLKELLPNYSFKE